MTIWGIPAAGIIVHGNIDSVSLTALRSSWTVSVGMEYGREGRGEKRGEKTYGIIVFTEKSGVYIP